MKGNLFRLLHFSPFLANGLIVQQKQSVLGSENMKCLAKFQFGNLPFLLLLISHLLNFFFFYCANWLIVLWRCGRWVVWIWEHLRVPGGTIIYTQLAACSNILLLIVVLFWWWFWWPCWCFENDYLHTAALTYSCWLLFWDQFLTLLMMMLIALLMPIIIIEKCGKG